MSDLSSNQCVHDFVCIECGFSLDDAQQPLGWMTEDGQTFVNDELKRARPDDFKEFSIAVPRATSTPAGHGSDESGRTGIFRNVGYVGTASGFIVRDGTFWVATFRNGEEAEQYVELRNGLSAKPTPASNPILRDALAKLPHHASTLMWSEAQEIVKEIERLEQRVAEQERDLYLLRNARDNLADNVHRLSDEPGALPPALDSLLCDVSQLLDGVKLTAPHEWTDWDQSVRDQITLLRQTKPTQADLAKIVGTAEPPAVPAFNPEPLLPPPDPLAVSHLRGLVYHWNEFGPEHGLDEQMHYAHEWLKRHDASTSLTKSEPASQGYVCKCGQRILYGNKHLNCPSEPTAEGALKELRERLGLPGETSAALLDIPHFLRKSDD